MKEKKKRWKLINNFEIIFTIVISIECEYSFIEIKLSKSILIKKKKKKIAKLKKTSKM